MESTARAVLKVPDLDLASFLETRVFMNEVGPFCQDIGLTHQNLLDSSFDCLCSEPSNGLVIELESFTSKNKLVFDVLKQRLEKLMSVQHVKISTPKLRKSVDRLKQDYKKYQKTKGTDKGACKLSSFC